MACPMGFGELNIPSSRAFWDDCDEDECNQISVEKLIFRYVTSDEHVKKLASECNQMFIIEGTSIVDFAESTLLKNSEKLADIPSKKSSLHYVDFKKMLIVILQEDFTYSGEICEILLDLCQPRDVFTLTVKSKVDFKSENIADFRDEITFLRSIDANLNNVKSLEPPNFIAGVAAGICFWRSNQGLDVKSFVAYTDNPALDYIAAKPILKLLQDLQIDCADSFQPKKRDDSHLYT